ncbi:hypothetical protein [Deinococcus aerophilus]|uniref:Uncharacterized protein n=1 Tax=Deinococcus aerophilus TaxID=522488 RepID=A0ABQ2GUK5_9DEIO|nr:hypothetical protein [Deinococcus aerophilus]GGM12560.1 hypothetical protein GCM10010841_21350 [Deinococcus aerophilus]
MTKDDPTGERDALPINPTLTPHLKPAAGHPPAAQGPAPEHPEGRTLPGVPAPAGDGMSAGEVTGLLGGDASMTEANIALERAEGLDPGPGPGTEG